MPSPDSSHGSNRYAQADQIASNSRKPSYSESSVDSRPRSLRSASPKGPITLAGVLIDIGHFVQLLEAVVSLQVSTQQKRTALTRSRQDVWKADEALAKAIRTAREEDVILDKDALLLLFDDCQQARDQLGPLEDSFQTADFHLVPKEDELIEKGGRIARNYQDLPRMKPDLEQAKLDLRSRTSQSGIVTPLARGRSPTIREPDLTDLDPFGLPNISSHRALQRSIHLPHDIPRAPTKQFGPDRVQVDLESLLNEIAPDLMSRPPWTQWTQFANEQESESFSPYVEEVDLFGVRVSEADDIEDQDDLLLGNDVQIRYPTVVDPYNLVNIWLLYGMRTSRLEGRRFRQTFVHTTSNGYRWSDVEALWLFDDTAVSNVTNGSDDSNMPPISKALLPFSEGRARTLSRLSSISRISSKSTVTPSTF